MTSPVDPDRLRAAYRTARDALLAERTPDGQWVGELSSSALSTAVAVAALALTGQRRDLIAGGLGWLANTQNADGGWGDTTKSFSNISTTMLCRAAVHVAGAAGECAEPLKRADAWLAERYGKTPAEHAEAVRKRYGKDRTFSVPILMTSALAGLVDWREVPPLPFELACLPQSWYRFARLPVVSYALPALIAIGQAIYHHRPPRNPLTRVTRRLAVRRSLRVLERIQPSSGGFLEAIPLTSFVVMALASIRASGVALAARGHSSAQAHDSPRGAYATPLAGAEQNVIQRGVAFIVHSARPDGSWPIDSNLATWVTTLSVNALAAAGDLDSLDKKDELRDWLLKQQFKERHPYTGADPGGWGWTDLPGSVPDADDTAGAILALTRLKTLPLNFLSSGFGWMRGLQNRDGGIPTFCRGWGKLPFDRSGTDLSAHVLRALAPWYGDLKLTPKILWDSTDELERLFADGLRYLTRSQRPDGSWLPLWFGNQHAPDDENPTYGTARVLAAYRDLGLMNEEPARRGIAWLVANQNDDGGWGGGRGTPSSVEETALAVEVLVDTTEAPAVHRGLAWLVTAVETGALMNPSPIGFYFAKLWYFERLYPIIFSVAALGRACRQSPTG
jgi:squalene-hopene/tetraprenyl-beta-curcumene cyclase